MNMKNETPECRFFLSSFRVHVYKAVVVVAVVVVAVTLGLRFVKKE